MLGRGLGLRLAGRVRVWDGRRTLPDPDRSCESRSGQVDRLRLGDRLNALPVLTRDRGFLLSTQDWHSAISGSRILHIDHRSGAYVSSLEAQYHDRLRVILIPGNSYEFVVVKL